MLYRLRDTLNRSVFSFATREILETLPVALHPSASLLVLSQLQHKDLLMYLLALKSFAVQVKVGAVAVLNDGSLTASDLDVLRHHVPGVELLQLQRYSSAACPRGGCWERLLAICERAADRYVIQLDSDTLALGGLDEVTACVLDESSFAIGTWDNQTLESMEERVSDAKELRPGQTSHVQLVAEANFDRLSGFRGMRYVRGCAGFSGFAQGSVTRESVESVSAEMHGAIGAKWADWGSEQVMSNIAVANSPRARVLPHPKYADCQKMREGESVFVHFIGSCRFRGGTYARLSEAVIQQLRSDELDS